MKALQDFVGYLNVNILSVVIKSTLKEGNKAQRVMIQTYNYDVENEEIPTLKDILNVNGISVKTAEEKIRKQVEYAYNKSLAVSTATSQTIYNRDLDSKIYLVDNISNFFIGEDEISFEPFVDNNEVLHYVTDECGKQGVVYHKKVDLT